MFEAYGPRKATSAARRSHQPKRGVKVQFAVQIEVFGLMFLLLMFLLRTNGRAAAVSQRERGYSRDAHGMHVVCMSTLIVKRAA